MIRPTKLQQLLEYDPATGLFRWRKRAYRQTKRWFSGFIGSNGYRFLKIDGRRHRAHIVAWILMTGRRPDRDMDHRDQDRRNNRWNNLRLATRSQNSMNQRIAKNNRTGVRGVSIYKGRGGLYRSAIQVNGKHVFLGLFKEIEPAIRARKLAEQQYYGEYAPQ